MINSQIKGKSSYRGAEQEIALERGIKIVMGIRSRSII